MITSEKVKTILKRIYMVFKHPYLFLKFYNKNVFVRGHSDIRHANQIECGKNIYFGYGTRINFFGDPKHLKKGLFIKNNVYICNRCSFIVGGKITIEEDVLIASDVVVVSHNHGIDPRLNLPYCKQPINLKEVKIGKGTWIGEKAIILPGVTIGQGCIIGAGAVVVKSIPEYSIAVGNPARIVKRYNFEKNHWERYYV